MPIYPVPFRPSTAVLQPSSQIDEQHTAGRQTHLKKAAWLVGCVALATPTTSSFKNRQISARFSRAVFTTTAVGALRFRPLLPLLPPPDGGRSVPIPLDGDCDSSTPFSPSCCPGCCGDFEEDKVVDEPDDWEELLDGGRCVDRDSRPPPPPFSGSISDGDSSSSSASPATSPAPPAAAAASLASSSGVGYSPRFTRCRSLYL